MTYTACCLPACIVRAAATFVNYVCTEKITQYFWRLGLPFTSNRPRVAREPARNKRCVPLQ